MSDEFYTVEAKSVKEEPKPEPTGLVRETVNAAGQYVTRYTNEHGVTIREEPREYTPPIYTTNLQDLIGQSREWRLDPNDVKEALGG